MVMKFEFFEDETCGGFFEFFACQFSPAEIVFSVCHQIFMTFFTLKFAISKEICHLALILGGTLPP